MTTSKSRILALDIRSYRAGFALFEGAQHLLDSGIVRYVSSDAFTRRINFLINAFSPTILVLPVLNPGPRRDRVLIQERFKTIRASAKEHRVGIDLVHQKRLKQYFGRHGARSKYDVACQLTQRFPDLGWKLPQKRKSWQREDRRMTIFDAVSLGICHFNQA